MPGRNIPDDVLSRWMVLEQLKELPGIRDEGLRPQGCVGRGKQAMARDGSGYLVQRSLE